MNPKTSHGGKVIYFNCVSSTERRTVARLAGAVEEIIAELNSSADTLNEWGLSNIVKRNIVDELKFPKFYEIIERLRDFAPRYPKAAKALNRLYAEFPEAREYLYF